MWLYKKERTRTNKYTKTIDHTSLVISTLGPLQKRKMVIHLQKKGRKNEKTKPFVATTQCITR